MKVFADPSGLKMESVGSRPVVGIVVPARGPAMGPFPAPPLPRETREPDPALPRGDWALTSSGRKFYPLSPKVDVVDIVDIAHSLSLQCRFGGHCSDFISVAQHSVLVAQLLGPRHKLVGLLHDATEAYLQDIIKPLKTGLGEKYAALETLWARTIGLALGLGDQLAELPGEVHQADRRVFVAERMYFGGKYDWKPEPMYPERIEPWSPARAKAEFLRHFEMYGGRA